MLHKRNRAETAFYPHPAAYTFGGGNRVSSVPIDFFTLDMLPIGAHAAVREILCGGFSGRRMMDLGLIPGAPVRALYKSPLGDPIAYEIFGAVIAIRKKDASNVRIQILP